MNEDPQTQEELEAFFESLPYLPVEKDDPDRDEKVKINRARRAKRIEVHGRFLGQDEES